MKRCKQVADILRACLPDVAILARYGGEEFAALLPQHDLTEAEDAGRTDSRELSWRMQANGERGRRLTLSVGCAEFGPHSRQAEGLALAAELAVSRAKQLGRNRVCRFDSVPGADQDRRPLSTPPFPQRWQPGDHSGAGRCRRRQRPVYAGAFAARGRIRHRACPATSGLPTDEQDLIYIDGHAARRRQNRRPGRHPEKAGASGRRRAGRSWKRTRFWAK